MKACDTLWGYCVGDQWLGDSTGLSTNPYGSLFSLRNGFTAYFALSPENGSFASVAREKLSLLPDLAPAPRRPNHTTSPYASGAYVYRALSVHRISPRVRDDREAPLICRETSGVVRLIWVRTEAEYFWFAGLTRFRKIRNDLPVRLGCRAR
jgi:hypothetical protein